ncbi:hypothetical protein L5G32_13035 [Gordonia sp. HY002]|uniref:hypothetical protein n=1 Tax=Gordonia zhenghanii TaxID=2911516 RepID=UPI001EF08059|nr:hypothetical protein [Gordonia zhenghanii]MCF8571195.1 hypothetical protein [Gordonia zhenghanii]MCF8606467.1 hypothetical protein [Gordonia zhenghanii]
MRSGAEKTLPVLVPGVPVLARGDSAVHVGCDPRSAIVLPLGPEADARAVAALFQMLRVPVSYRTIAKRVRAAGLDYMSFRSMLERLVLAGKAAVSAPPRVLTVHVPGSGDVATALSAALRRAGVHVDDAHGGAGLVVVADQPIPDPALIADLMAAGTPHLSVHLRDGVGVVGPLVLPGTSTCLRCIDLYRADLDPQWPVLAALMSGIAGYASPAVLQATVAVACTQIDEVTAPVPRGAPASVGRTFEFSEHPSRLSSHVVAPHTRCMCVVA